MSKRSLSILMLIIGFGLGVGAGVFGILWSTGNLSPSTNAANVVPTLSLDGPTPTPGVVNALSTEIANLNDKVDGLSGQVSTIAQDTQLIQTQIAQGISVAESQSMPTTVPDDIEPAVTEDANTDASANASLPERQLYRIVSEESQVNFRINEVLMGNPKEVIASTDDVAGDVIVNFGDPAASQLGEIAINARTFKTDNEFRDQSIRGQILNTSSAENEFIRFVPTGFTSMPTGAVNIGDTVEFDLIGDLTVKGTTNSVTFHASVTIESADRISGTASAEVLYADFGINIQAPPSVSGIEDNVILEINFVATVPSE